MEIPLIFRKDGKALSLRANFSWTVAGNVLYAATQWGLTILMTKLYAPEVFGRFALALSIVTPIFTASALQLREVMVSDATGKTSFSGYLSLRMITSASALILVVFIGLIGHFPTQTFNLLIFLGLGQAVIMIKDIFQGAMQRAERMDAASFSRTLQGIVSLVCAACLTIATKNVIFVAVGMGIARFLILIGYDIPFSRTLPDAGFLTEEVRRKAIFRAQEALRLARIAFPMGIVTLFISLHANIPRYFLAGSFGEETVGFYSAVSTYMALEEMVISAMGQSAARRLSTLYLNRKQSFFSLLGKLSLMGIAVGIAGVGAALLFGKEILTFFFTKEYAMYANVLAWLMVARIVLNAYSFIGYGMTAARKFAVQIWVSGLMTGSLFLASWGLVPHYGILGTAWAILLSAAAGLIASLCVMRKDFTSVMRGTA